MELAKQIGAALSIVLSDGPEGINCTITSTTKSSSINRSEDDPNNLLDMMRNGVAFHNASLGRDLRRCSWKKDFRICLIKVIVATPTLAQGVNLPARRVIIQSRYRYDTNGKYEEIPRMGNNEHDGTRWQARAGSVRRGNLGGGLGRQGSHNADGNRTVNPSG